MHANVYCEFGVCLAGKFAIQNFARAPHSTIQRSAPRFTNSTAYALSKLQNLRPSHEERIVGTLASIPLVLGPLPVGAGPHQAEAAWAPQHHTVSAPRGSLGNGGVAGGAPTLRLKGARSGEVSLDGSTRRSPRSGAAAAVGRNTPTGWLAGLPGSCSTSLDKQGLATYRTGMAPRRSLPSRVQYPRSQSTLLVTKWTIFTMNVRGTLPSTPLVNTTSLMDK